ncbi:MFS transporter [Niallia sp. 03133]|uniref:MFS transporter n=1 Tax=Niallia sp. 03133 TaxID=3458060 RepID=UPI004044E5FF
MKKYSKAFKALWMGEIISEFGGASGAILNGLLLYELTGSKEWMGTLWLVYYIPSILLQYISAPFLNYVSKERMLSSVQLIRATAYILPLIGYLSFHKTGAIIGLIVLQCLLGLVQPIYASISFSLLPEICKDKELVEANGLLDSTIRLMSFLAPGAISLLLISFPLHCLYGVSAFLFLLSYFSLTYLPRTSKSRAISWSKKLWWEELQKGYRLFFQYCELVKLTLLSSTVHFAVGATLVLNIPFIRGTMNGQAWEYGIFAGAFPIGYVIGTLLLKKIPITFYSMYVGLIGGGLSFILLFFVQTIPFAWICEVFGGIAFPIFNVQSAAAFQKEAPKARLAQLSSVRLLFMRVMMPLGILFASSTLFSFTIRQNYFIIGMIIFLPATILLLQSFKAQHKSTYEG